MLNKPEIIINHCKPLQTIKNHTYIQTHQQTNPPTHQPALEESDVDEGGVVVDKLEDVDLVTKTVVVVLLRPQALPLSQSHRQLLVNLVTFVAFLFVLFL